MKTILSFILLFILSVSYSQEIDYFLGYKLGNILNPWDKNIDKKLYGNTYQIKSVRTKFRYFTTCRIETNQENIIKKIHATYNFKSEIEAKEEYEIIKRMLCTKYKTATFKNWGFSIEILKNNNAIRLSRTITRITLTYTRNINPTKLRPNEKRIQKAIRNTETYGI